MYDTMSPDGNIGSWIALRQLCVKWSGPNLSRQMNDDQSTKTKTNEIGGSYNMGDVTFVATQTKTPVTKANSIGLSYAIAPGLSFSAESGEVTGTGANSATYMGLHVKF